MATSQTPTYTSGTSDPFQAHRQQQHDIGRDLIDYLKEYAREKPEVAALWCFGIGFILGWKLKPW
jgi:hypothetical protein